MKLTKPNVYVVGRDKPVYCEECFQDLVSQNVKLQLELDERKHILTTNNPYATPFTPKFPDIKVPNIEIPKIEITSLPKPENIKFGMDLADGPDETVEEWKKEDKPGPDYAPIMDAIKDWAKQQQERADEINEGRGV